MSPSMVRLLSLQAHQTCSDQLGLTGSGHADFMGVKPSASQDDISKAYRKKSRLLHPDKAKQTFVASQAKKQNKPKIPGTKKPKVHVNKPPSESEIQKAVRGAEQRYARLGVVAEILKGSGRERYDFFLSKGFPAWRGTGYYYARYRPGLGSVLFGLFLFGGGLVHYGALYVGWKRQREFVDRYVRHARRTAWGDDLGIRGIPAIDGTGAGTNASLHTSTAGESGQSVLNRRQKRLQDREAKKEKKTGNASKKSGLGTPPEPDPEVQGPQGAKKRVQAENGKILIVDSSGNVFLEEENEDGEAGEYLLDPNEIPRPTYHDTVVFRLPIWIYRLIKRRLLGTSPSADARPVGEDGSSSEDGATKASAVSRSSADKAKRRGKRNGKA